MEIDPLVVQLSARWLGLNFETVSGPLGEEAAASGGAADGRFAVCVADGADWMARAVVAVQRERSVARAAVICLDAYDGAGQVPAYLQSSRFLRSCAALLRPGGVLLANVWLAAGGFDAFVRALREGFATVEQREVPGDDKNVVLVAVL